MLTFVVAVGAVYGVDAVATRATPRIVVWRPIGVGLAAVMSGLGLILTLIAYAGDRATPVVGFSLIAAGVVLAGIVSRRSRQWILRLLPHGSSSPRDWLGLLAILWLVIVRLALFYQADSDVGEVRIAEILFQTAVFIGIACALVGLFVRRTLRQTLERLGIRQLSLRSYLFSTFAVLPFALIAALTVLFVEFVQPGTMDRLENTVTGMTGGQTSLQFGLILGLSAALGEETLFRGALQPKYGILLTSMIFALLHVQYDLFLVVASLFPVGVILGLERKYMGTTASIITHTLYNALVVVAGY